MNQIGPIPHSHKDNFTAISANLQNLPLRPQNLPLPRGRSNAAAGSHDRVFRDGVCRERHLVLLDPDRCVVGDDPSEHNQASRAKAEFFGADDPSRAVDADGTVTGVQDCEDADNQKRGRGQSPF